MGTGIRGFLVVCCAFGLGAIEARPCCEVPQCEASRWWNNISVGADWLYWKAEQSEMELAVSVTASGGGTQVDSNVILPQAEYSSGYRVFVGYAYKPCWTVDVSLTHVAADLAESINKNPADIASDFVTFNTSLYPIVTAYSGASLSSFDSNWDLDLYYLDGVIRYSWCVCPCITLEPFAGARGFWMKQNFSMAGSTTGQFISIELKEKFCGGGLVGGISGYWDWGCGVSLFGQFGASLVYSRVETDDTVIGSIVDISSGYCMHKALPTLDSAIGLRYCFSLCTCGGELHIGWENHLFFHTNQQAVTADGNLTMQGLTLGGSVYF